MIIQTAFILQLVVFAASIANFGQACCDRDLINMVSGVLSMFLYGFLVYALWTVWPS